MAAECDITRAGSVSVGTRTEVMSQGCILSKYVYSSKNKLSKIIINNNNNKVLMMSERHVSVLLSVSERHNHAAEVGQVRVEEPQQEAHLVDTYYRYCRYRRYCRYCI